MNSPRDVVAAMLDLLIVLILVGIWLFLVVFGVKTAKEKNRSPHWMWFGVHPLGALIAFIVLKCVDPLKLCPQCARTSPPAARVCPYCTHTFDAPSGLPGSQTLGI